MAWSPDTSFALRPALREQLDRLVASASAAGVDPALIERCRRHVVARIAREPTPPGSGGRDGEQAAVDFAEQFALDVRGFTDADDTALHEHFTDAQLTTLTFAVATFDAIARVNAVLGTDLAP
jgi:alkylhydroperoxidase family enzyme